jgi:peptide chain release factor subunit 1
MNNRTDAVEVHLDRLALFEPTNFPVISLYLDLRPDERGRDHFQPFVRKELRARSKIFGDRSPERESFDKDIEKIRSYLQNEIRPECNGAAIFACSGSNDFFDALQVPAPIEANSLHVGQQPHLYPLAKLSSHYRRYACLVADTNSAKIYIFGSGERLDREEISNAKTKRIQAGGWAQARYQRHVDHQRQQHVKEVVENLAKIVRTEKVEKVFLAGDEVIIPKIREQLTAELKPLVVDEIKLDKNAPESEILQETLKSARSHEGIEEKVKELLDQYRAGGLGVVGARDTLLALSAGQVNELIISSDPNSIVNNLVPEEAPFVASDTPATDPVNLEPPNLKIAETLILRARQTGADVTFVENRDLLAGAGGTGALLRYRIQNRG